MLNTIAERINTGLNGQGFEGSLKFDCGADGVLVLADNMASTVDRDTDCTIRLSLENLKALLAGKLNPMTGVMMGKLKISGNPAVAMKLGSLLK
ncbi:SCP2 sterol-binding domain-containing protein [Lutimaribacter sp. EGI FJ00015]|uniref:SCP2 sterol-binding domain-containing protein n=1 Tax=Lutimaribacter degradans TaxID=2945989 RepID=A0ACC5ZX51_9RHOB|nr:SCP2 sterol-binding domain-containing protein [Lutimaribacter sp. EGI FJ00013]MCM2561959.1 SCP2 sterol-binding domain-containing protein [Lutimaribacter sp. EGI FJ00013]MCO0613009.1 SCP2 sterol-binding domain-containing protein [Lutimaribacter sp. EGI FJ00015]MCO0635791.1 SCP2 sterol-binding domain-containing protein [Lutimaribacter sp. EGI FJ00014]